ncbi:Lipase 3 [Phytophthora cinnamomi]|uniref:Lipase 3 n=1 Tax=Phytophthora cinnamomi TaxID=4785 RepID=UPI0035596117|nr:Lipase 3 [Phytophthora cinnamomi]
MLVSTASESSSATTPSLNSEEPDSVGAVATTVSATIAVMMQTYLMPFVLSGNPNSESSVGTFNNIFTIADDDLANAKSLFCNKAPW